MDFLKALFKDASEGKLSYDEFKAACEAGKIKLANLATGDYVAKQKYTDDLNVRDTRINNLEGTITARDNDLKDLRAQLEAAGADKEKLSTLTSQLEGLQSKYDADTKKLADDMLNQRKTYAVKDYANSKKFTSQAARRDFEAYLMNKEFSLSDDGNLIGGDDFVAEYSKNNADAFVIEEPDTKPQNSEPLPQFVAPTPGDGGGNKNSFSFKFTGVRPHTEGDD